MTLMGTGTSHGLPVIGCSCRVCTSPYKKDKRLRCSALIEAPCAPDEKVPTHRAAPQAADEEAAACKSLSVLIDAGPEFRLQALRYHIAHLNAVLLTHSHADHLHGLDDLRIFSYVKLHGTRGAADASCTSTELQESGGEALSVYCNKTALSDVQYRFSYVFEPPKIGGGMPKIQLVENSAYTPESPLAIGALRIIPIPMLHGALPVSGYLISCTGGDAKKHSIAYLTDCSNIPQSSLSLIKQHAGILDHAVIDGLRRKPHATHCSYDEALMYAEELKPRHTWLTHLAHDMRHTEIQRYINAQLSLYPSLQRIVADEGGSVSPAYDGLILQSGE